MKFGFFTGFVALGLTCVVSSAVSAGECLNYEPAVVTIQGSLSFEPAYGPPGFGEDPKHDAREDYLALTLDAPVCILASPVLRTDDVAEAGIRTMQLVLRSSAAFQQAKEWIGKQVSVTGGIYHGSTGHHHTAVLLNVKKIVPAR